MVRKSPSVVKTFTKQSDAIRGVKIDLKALVISVRKTHATFEKSRSDWSSALTRVRLSMRAFVYFLFGVM